MADNWSGPQLAKRSHIPWREAAFLLCIAATAVAGAFAYVFLLEPRRPSRAASEESLAFGGLPPSMNTPFFAPGIRQPPTVAAAAADLDDGTEVIGVSAGGKQRAYKVRAFDNSFWHIVNDLLGELPVTVTYCDRCDCVQVFVGEKGGGSLNVSLGGWLDNRMLLRLGEVFFMQDTGQATTSEGGAPLLPAYPYERTTWKAWKTSHPDTDVYLGVSAEAVMAQQ